MGDDRSVTPRAHVEKSLKRILTREEEPSVVQLAVLQPEVETE